MIAKGSYILLTQRIAVEDKEYVAVCDDLGLATSGVSFDDAHERLDEAVQAVLVRMSDRRQLEQYLGDNNVRIHMANSTPEIEPVCIRGPNEWVTVCPVEIPVGALA